MCINIIVYCCQYSTAVAPHVARVLHVLTGLFMIIIYLLYILLLIIYVLATAIMLVIFYLLD